jgi:hypothetical protein
VPLCCQLPDAIVIASAVLNAAVVLTNDAVLLKLDAAELGYLAHAF